MNGTWKMKWTKEHSAFHAFYSLHMQNKCRAQTNASLRRVWHRKESQKATQTGEKALNVDKIYQR